MRKFRYDEHGVGYQVGKKLQPWRPQNSIIVSWIKPHSKVLDVGCGDGVLAEKLLKERKCQITGIDLDINGVKEAKRSGIRALVQDINAGLNFKAHSFDVVICSDVIQYLQKPNFVVQEILRVGKKAIIQFPNFGFWAYRLLTLSGRFPKLALFGHSWFESPLTRLFSLNDFKSLPSMKNVKITRLVGVNWANRKPSFLAKFAPNFFARSCILELSKNQLNQIELNGRLNKLLAI